MKMYEYTVEVAMIKECGRLDEGDISCVIFFCPDKCNEEVSKDISHSTPQHRKWTRSYFSGPKDLSSCNQKFTFVKDTVKFNQPIQYTPFLCNL